MCSYKKWVSLTDHIGPLLLERLMPECGKIFAATPLQSQSSTTESRRAAAASAAEHPCDSTPTSHTEARLGSTFSRDDINCELGLPRMDPVPGTQIRFSVIPWTCCVGASPAEVTLHGMDRSSTLESLLASYSTAVGADAGLLGELQFAFVCFIIGQVCKHVVQLFLLFNCYFSFIYLFAKLLFFV